MCSIKKPLRPGSALQSEHSESSRPGKALPTFVSLGDLLSKIAPRKRDWILQQVRNRVATVSFDDSPESQYQLLKAVIVACYPTNIQAALVAHQVAAGESLAREFEGISLSPAQLKSLLQPQPPAQAAIQHLTYACDVSHHTYFHDPFAIDFLFRNLRTIVEIFERRKDRMDVDLNKEFGFSVPGRGKTSQVKKTQSQYRWSENCFEVHMLVLSGRGLVHACGVFTNEYQRGKNSSSRESLEKMYRRWHKEAITSVRLQLGDALAKTILSQQAPREILAKRFPLSSA